MENKSLTYRIGAWMLKNRGPILVLILLATIFFGYHASKVRLRNPTIDLFPKSHPYVETYVKYEDVFGGANIVIIALEVEQGDIFNTKTFKKIKNITKALEFLPAVNNYQVLSLAQRKIKKTRVHDVEGYKSDPIMWPSIPETEEGVKAVQRSVYTTGRLHGSLVSINDKAALVLAGFFEKGLISPGAPLKDVVVAMAKAENQDPAKALEVIEKVAANEIWTVDDTLYQAINKIVKAEEDDNTTVFMIGQPVLLGHIYQKFPQLYWIFMLTVLSIIGVLFIYFRDIRGVTIPVITALISAIWGVGFLGFLGYHFNPLVIVVPFIISARALSHSVQLIERYLEELDKTGDRNEASIRTFSGLFKPGMLSIITDAAGVFIVILTPIPLMEKLALMGSFWVLSIIVSDVIFNPIFLSFFPTPKINQSEKATLLDRLLEAIGRTICSKKRNYILAGTIVVFIIGALFAKNLVIGDVHPGTPLLWPSSKYNQDTARIGELFGNTEIMSVVVEGQKKNSIKAPSVLLNMEGLQRRLEQLDEVTTTSSIADLMPEITKIMHGSNPKWELIPKEAQESGFYLGMIFSGAEPGDLARFITNDFKDANISVYLKDHKGETLREVVAAAKDYIDTHTMVNPEVDPIGYLDDLKSALEIKDGEKPAPEALESFVKDYLAKTPFTGQQEDFPPYFHTMTKAFASAELDKSAIDKGLGWINAYLTEYPIEEATFRLAGNYGGLLAAVNEAIVASEAKVAIMAFVLVFVFCTLAYKSGWAGIIFLIPILISNYLTYALMGALGIGLDVNALPVVSLGVGLGVDYGLYVLGRVEEEYEINPDIHAATIRAIATAGRAVLFTASTMVAGIIFWAFSFLRFQAEMGILLAFWMIVSMVGGLVLLPTLVVVFKPKFITKGR